MPARILVIEDNPENLELMSYLLKAFGHTVTTATDGEEGLEAARREPPDLIISDLLMPKMDGYQVIRAVRRDPCLAQLPIVAVTAYAMRGDRDKVLAAGFDGYISKPIVPEEFASQIERYLVPVRHSAVKRSSASPPPGTKPKRGTILVVDNSPVNLHLMRSTLEPFGYKVITTSTVQEGLQVARQSPPDLILSDLHMPDVGGYDFLEAAKSDPKLKTIPFAIISSTVWRETDPNIALSLGARRFITRPIEPQELVAAVESCLALRGGGPAGEATPPPDAENPKSHGR